MLDYVRIYVYVIKRFRNLYILHTMCSSIDEFVVKQPSWSWLELQVRLAFIYPRAIVRSNYPRRRDNNCRYTDSRRTCSTQDWRTDCSKLRECIYVRRVYIYVHISSNDTELGDNDIKLTYKCKLSLVIFAFLFFSLFTDFSKAWYRFVLFLEMNDII